ncbi:MAG: hypothetical protein M3179_06915 [Actinomycetota bacterium]|nr:hypothetical protein [Actinomycetota bacterium]
MRQRRRTTRAPSTGATGSSPSGLGGAAARPGDPGALLVQRWDELLRLVPPDLGLNASLGQGSQGLAGDPIAWLSAAANVAREDLDQVRHVRNSLVSNRPVPDEVSSSALHTLDRALAVVGRTRLPE